MKATDRVVACFLFFAACLLWPVVSIANRPVAVLGIPALVLYLFAVWAAIVVALVFVSRQPRQPEDGA